MPTAKIIALTLATILSIANLSCGNRSQNVENSTEFCIDMLKSEKELISQPLFFNRATERNELILNGLKISADSNVAIEAFNRVVFVINNMLNEKEFIFSLLKPYHIRILIIGKYQAMTDLPEYRMLKFDPKVNWDLRAKGLGPTKALPIVSIGEENLLKLQFDRYKNQDIFVHEFAHAIFYCLSSSCPQFLEAVSESYQNALNKGLWKNTYAETNIDEYFAVTSMSWFNAITENPRSEIKNNINTRAELKEYDRKIYDIFDIIYSKDYFPY